MKVLAETITEANILALRTYYETEPSSNKEARFTAFRLVAQALEGDALAKVWCAALYNIAFDKR